MAAPMQDNNIDLNNNGIPDKFEYKDAVDLSNFQPQGNAFDDAYTSEEQIAKEYLTTNHISGSESLMKVTFTLMDKSLKI